MKLVACPTCHAQYDVADVDADLVACPCGTTFPAVPPAARDSSVLRCAGCGALVDEGGRSCSYCGAAVTRVAPTAGPVCPECYARSAERARRCSSCGVEFLPQPVRTAGEAPACPVCPGARLAARNLGGLWVDECPQCLGLWAPGDVMDRLVERARERRAREGGPPADAAHRPRRAAWQDEVAYRRCPACGGRMQRRNFGRRSGVVVDWCGHHGTWLDADEMEDIAAFVLGGGLDAAGAGGRDWMLPADPARTAAVLAAEGILAEERARSQARRRGGSWEGGALRGIGDLFAKLLK